MFILTAVISILLAAALAGAAFGKLTKNPQVIEGLVKKVGVPEERIWQLAGLELAAAAGLIIGLFWAPLGIAAAIGVVLYFIGALVAHFRVNDTAAASIVPPTVILLVAVATVVLRATTA